MSKMFAMDVDQDGNMDKILELVRRQDIGLYSDCSGNSIHPNTPPSLNPITVSFVNFILLSPHVLHGTPY